MTAVSMERHLVATAPAGGFSTAPLSIAERDTFRRAMIAERVAVGFCPLHTVLLTPPSANPKLGKSGTYGLSLAAASLSGSWNVCRHSTSGCRSVCLWSSGKGSLDSVQRGRIWKTRLLGSHPELFIRSLASATAGLTRATVWARTGPFKRSFRLAVGKVRAGIVYGSDAPSLPVLRLF